jgi:hypothetical protein
MNDAGGVAGNRIYPRLRAGFAMGYFLSVTSLSDVDSDGGHARGRAAVVDLACADELEARRSQT